MKKESIKSVSIYVGIFIALLPAVFMEIYPAGQDSVYRIIQVVVLIFCAFGLPKIVETIEDFLTRKYLDK